MGDLVFVLIALGHQCVIGRVHPSQLGLEVLAGGGSDIAVADLGGDLVHALPANHGDAVGVARSDGLAGREDGRAAGGPAGLDLDIAQGVEAEVIVDLRRRQKLVTEVVRKL